MKVGGGERDPGAAHQQGARLHSREPLVVVKRWLWEAAPFGLLAASQTETAAPRWPVGVMVPITAALWSTGRWGVLCLSVHHSVPLASRRPSLV